MLYIHVPFCKSFCIYCDFYSETDSSLMERYVREVVEEIKHNPIQGGPRTIYIGGGTPSALPAPLLAEISAAALEAAGPVDEFTIEVNPDDITPEYAAALKRMGATRISMGVQSLDDGMLRWMRRRHTSEGARRAFRTLREAGFTNISLDLIFGVNGMSDEMLARTLDGLQELGPEHISAYQLSVEPGSALGTCGAYEELPDEDCARQYELICSHLRAAGFVHYEISNWAREPRFVAVHNSAYWTREPYVGVGPGAHSLLPDRRTRRWNTQRLTGWGIEGSETLTDEQVREEEIMLGLRTARGWNGTVIPEKDWFISDSIIASML